MAEPGASADMGGGLAAPSPPQPPTQAETTDTNMHGAGVPTEVPTAGQPPLQTEASDAGAQPPRAPSQERAAATEAENMPPAPAAPTEAPTAGQLPLQAEASGAGAQPPRAPSQERTAAAEANNMPPAPPAPTAGQPPLQAEASGAGAQPPRASSQDRAAAAEAENMPPAPPAPTEAATAGQPPLQAEASGAGAQPPRALSQDKAAEAEAENMRPAPPAPTEAPTAGQPPLQAKASGAGAQPPRAPSQERAAAAEAKNMPPAPPPPQEQQHDGNAKDGEGSATTKPRQSRWPRVRSPVLWLLSLFHLRSQSQLTKQHKITPPPLEESGGAAGVPDKPATEKDDGEGSKRRRHEEEATPTSASGRKEFPPTKPQSGVTGGAPDEGCRQMKKKLQNKGSFVRKIMAWYRRHRSQEKVDKPVVKAAAQNENVEETKPSASSAPQEEEETKSKGDKAEEITKQEPKEDKPGEHPLWGWAEVRLEDILEEAFRRLVAGEFRNLDDEKQKCLLTFSVFPLDQQVKKQAVTYWWATQFRLPMEKGKGKEADDIFSMLSGKGFLEPIKNRCSGVIHGCRVNPLVHWTVKRLARENDFADLKGDGNPADQQPKSAVLCLTPGSRDRLQKLRKHDESQSKDRPKPQGKKKTSKKRPEVPSQDVPTKTSLEDKKDEKDEIILKEFEKKRVILNIDAHVYRLPEPLLSKLSDHLVVLQLGRWWNLDDKTYMEVEALKYIGELKNLQYLSLRGLSRMTELPKEFRQLHRLTILDVRGCQNLAKVSTCTIRYLKGLTHLDLTECYMLEYIGRGVSALSELEVFKGFVFSVGASRGKACRVGDLVKLRKLRKLSINITTDATVDKDEMKRLQELTGLLSLTVTWGELPSILWDVSKEDPRRKGLLNGWTGLILPPKLEKLDVRCYPDDKLPADKWFENHNLKKLYVRGGDVKVLNIPKENKIETLRLRYLNKFEMKWGELFGKLNSDCIKFVEVVDKDQKVVMNQTKGKGEKVRDEKEHKPIKERMDVPMSTLDENGVWVRDAKEKYAFITDGDSDKEQTGKEGRGTEEKDEPPNEENRGDTDEVKRVDGGDDNGREMVKEEQDNKKAKEEEEHYPIKSRMRVQESTLDENGARMRDEKKLKEDEKRRTSSAAAIDQTVGLASSKDVKKGAGADDGGTDKSSEPLKASQAPRMAPKEDATKTEAATGAADIPKVSDKGGEGDDDGRDGDAEAEDDEPANEEDRGNVRELKKFDGGDADKARTEGEGEGEGEGEDEDEGQGRRHEVVDAVDEQSTAGEDGGDDDTGAPDASSSPAAKRPELKEEIPAKLIPAAKASASRTTTLPAPPAATGPAPAIVGEAAAEPKEPGKAGGDDGLGGTGATDTRSSTYA